MEFREEYASQTTDNGLVVLAVVDVVFSALGLALTIVLAFGFFVVWLPYAWVASLTATGLDTLAVMLGALSIFPALAGAALGLVALLSARKTGGSVKTAKWAMALGLTALAGTGVSFVVNAFLGGVWHP